MWPLLAAYIYQIDIQVSAWVYDDINIYFSHQESSLGGFSSARWSALYTSSLISSRSYSLANCRRRLQRSVGGLKKYKQEG